MKLAKNTTEKISVVLINIDYFDKYRILKEDARFKIKYELLLKLIIYLAKNINFKYTYRRTFVKIVTENTMPFHPNQETYICLK